MGSVPGRGRSHLPWSTEAHAPPPGSLCSRAWELQLHCSPCFWCNWRKTDAAGKAPHNQKQAKRRCSSHVKFTGAAERQDKLNCVCQRLLLGAEIYLTSRVHGKERPEPPAITEYSRCLSHYFTGSMTQMVMK